MKKVGIALFIVTLVAGVIVANCLSFGRSATSVFNFSFGVSGTRGSGKIATDHRDLAGFHGLDVGGIFQVEATAQKEYSVEIESDDNLLPLIHAEVVDGILKIESEGRLKPTSGIRVRVSAPNIDQVEASGASSMTVNGLSNPSLSVDSSGASKVNITGSTAQLTLSTSGATKVNAEALTAQNAVIDASGASRITLNVKSQLKADASGASHISYIGEPASVQKSTTGAASVSAE